jgi:hypothetical protein
MARVLSGDLDGGDACLEDAVSLAKQAGPFDGSRSPCANDHWWR